MEARCCSEVSVLNHIKNVDTRTTVRTTVALRPFNEGDLKFHFQKHKFKSYLVLSSERSTMLSTATAVTEMLQNLLKPKCRA